jgi:hypothetical protein
MAHTPYNCHHCLFKLLEKSNNERDSDRFHRFFIIILWWLAAGCTFLTERILIDAIFKFQGAKLSESVNFRKFIWLNLAEH